MLALDIDDAIRLGGWDARYARPLAAGTHGESAAALVDSNGDGAAIELDMYHWRDGAWEAGLSGGVGSKGTAWQDGFAATFGRARPNERCAVEHAGQRFHVTASATGWWLALTPAPGGPGPA